MIDTQSLKNKILDLAIRGKLTRQLPEDGTAEELYEKIQEEKQALVEAGKIKKEKPLKEIEKDEVPFEIPGNWKWVRFGEIGIFKKGPFGSSLTKSMFVPKGIDTVKVYEQQNAIKKDKSLGTYYITRDYFDSKMKNFEVCSGDIIVSCAGTIGETYIMPDEIEKGIINQALMKVTLVPSVDKRFFQYFFDYNLKKSANEESNGSAIKNIPPFEVLKNWLFPVPSLKEQCKIIDKVEILLTEIDTIEKLQTQYAADAKILKSKLIDAAIQGKLTKQLPSDGTAEELYQQIQTEKQALISAGKIKKEKPLKEIEEDEIPFEIPESWKWCRLGSVTEITMGQSPKGENVGKEGMEFHQGKIFFSDMYLQNSHQFTKEVTRIAHKNSVLLCVRAPVGIVNVTKRDICIGRGLCALAPLANMDPLFIFYYLLSCRKELENKGTGSTFSSISAQVVKEHIIPLPPLAEQKKIVDKLKEILKYVT